MKKIVIGLAALIFSFGVFKAETSYASSITWILVDKKTTTGATTYLNGVRSGLAKICLKDQFGGLRFNLYDNDGSSFPLIKAGLFIGNNSCYTFDATPYIDGTDNDAEFVLQTTQTPIGSYILELWD